MERKKREHAQVGKLHYLNISKEGSAECEPLLKALGAECRNFLLKERSWAEAYDEVIDCIADDLKK